MPRDRRLIGARSNTRAAVDALVGAANRVTEDVFHCLADVNREAAYAYLMLLESNQPTIHGGSQPATHARLAGIQYATDPPDKRLELHARDTTANAVADVARMTGLYLYAADPVTHSEMRANPAPEVPPSRIKAMASRDDRMEARIRNYASYAPEPALAPILFHESLHLARFKTGDTGHVYNDPTDEVYSCAQLCTGPRHKVTVQSCLGCMGAMGHEITDSDRAFCRRHFGAKP